MPDNATSTKRRIIDAVRTSEEPVLTAAEIAGETGLQKRTINNHVDELVAAGRLKRKSAGQAFVYYLADRETRDRQHTCTRCGWSIDRDTAYATIEVTPYHDRPHEPSDPPSQFLVCRVCENDVIDAIMGEDQNIGDYPYVHAWNIPEDQLHELREDDSIQTFPEAASVGGHGEVVLEGIRSLGAESGVPAPELVEFLTSDETVDARDDDLDLDEDRIRDEISTLEDLGLIYLADKGWRPAK
jgi:hypothetical protein